MYDFQVMFSLFESYQSGKLPRQMVAITDVSRQAQSGSQIRDGS